MSVTSHFLYLIFRSTRNAALRQLRRLRNPRYAIAALVGLAYFVFIFSGWGRSTPSGEAYSGPWVTVARTIGPLLLGLLAAWWWLWGGHRRAITLSPAETNLLLTAPLTRRQIIRFKILQTQAPMLMSALIGTLLMRGTGLPSPLRFLSVWVMLATLHLHQVAASLVHAAAEEHGVRGLRRHLAPMLVFGVAFAALMFALLRALADIRAGFSSSGAADRLVALLAETAPRIVLAPFRLLLAPTLAASVSEWALAFLLAVIVLGAHYLWVQSTDAAFEESAIAEGERRAERVHAVRTGGLARVAFTRSDRPKQLARPLLPLAGLPFSAYAIFWKNVLYVQRSVRTLSLALSVVWLGVVLVLIGSAADDGQEAMRSYGFVCMGLAALLTLGGPLVFRNDLRIDLRYLDLLRTYPIRGRDMVAAQIAGSTLVVTTVQLVLVWFGLAFLVASDFLPLTRALAAAVAAVVALPLVNALGVTIQNALALLYPGWLRIGETASGGMEMIGQNVLTLIGALILLLICALPPMIVGGLVGFPLALLLGNGAALIGGAAALATVAGEVFLLTLWLGRLYDRTDPIEVGLLR